MNNNNTGITGIIPFTYFSGVPKRAGSTFLRVEGLVMRDTGFNYWQHGHRYDNLIFQKAYWIEMMELFEGPKILDLCDPDWIYDQVDIVAISSLVHAITCSSPGLTDLVKKMLPGKMVFYVPDRLNFNIFPQAKKLHRGTARQAVWFGFINNAHEALEQLLPSILKNNLRLTIIAERPYSKEDAVQEAISHFIQYDPSVAYKQIRQFDMVLNPRSDKAFFKHKSNNKSLIGWKLGLPVAATNEDVDRFMDPVERNREIREKQRLIEPDYDIIRSGQEYRHILSLIQKEFFSWKSNN